MRIRSAVWNGALKERAALLACREALRGLLADIEEYQTINHLGGHDNHWQVASRAALAQADKVVGK